MVSITQATTQPRTHACTQQLLLLKRQLAMHHASRF
jgi:hypothetical protein